MIWLNLLAGGIISVIGTVCVAAASQKAFWDKIHYVYGLLLPCMTFRVTFTCPKLRVLFNPQSTVPAFALPVPKTPNWVDLVWALASCGVLALIVVFNRKRASRAGKFAVFVSLYVCRTSSFSVFGRIFVLNDLRRDLLRNVSCTDMHSVWGWR